jgi:hypothetical protein
MNQTKKSIKNFLLKYNPGKQIREIKSMWHQIPEQLRRLSVLIVVLVILFIIFQSLLVPSDFGKYGHFRASAVDEIVSQEIRYAGQEACSDCHSEFADHKNTGYHKDLSCEVCHGPAAAHIEEPGSIELLAPRGRGYCPLCHEYLPSRPTGFPQIVTESHNPMKPCITCHDAHNPTTPETPKECHACHAEISRTKSLSHHVYVSCIQCHETPEEHKLQPRRFLPGKPTDRKFCGECHAIDAPVDRGIPSIDLESHGERYVCWQCHYPHLPEAQ